MTKSTFDQSEVNTALCIWEEMLARYRDDLTSEHPKWRHELDAMWKAYGTASMRDVAIDLVETADALWVWLGDERSDLFAPFDWEFVPWLLAQLNWSRLGERVPRMEKLQELAQTEFAIRRARELVLRGG